MADPVLGNIDLNTQMLVICEDDYLFNNRWFLYSEAREGDLVNYAAQVLVRSDQVFENLFKFNDLRCLKFSRVRLTQFKHFKMAAMHLEIDLLLADHDFRGTPRQQKELNRIRMPRLRRLKIDKLDDTLRDTVRFSTSVLDSVKLGKKDWK